MARVTGIGGVFFRSADPAATVAWYRDHLGIEPEPAYPCAVLRSSGGETTVWAPFEDDTPYFGDRGQQLMVNYRVDDLDEMLEHLRAQGVDVLDAREDADNGRFAWAVDGEGRRFELWEPATGH
jgi:predicted enzyme related to lactoylglutathione lyase